MPTVNQKKIINILCCVGTRPEVIKMAPVIWQIEKTPGLSATVINTAQHRELIDDMLMLFNIQPSHDLNIMQTNQSLSSLTGHLFLKLEPLIDKEKYDLVLAQGDTTTTLVTAQIAYYKKMPFGHIEAGLRTNDFLNPFPEEMNRVFISKIASFHFAPTTIEEEALKKEGIYQPIYVTGNTVIDSLYYWANQDTPLPFTLPKNKRIILLTLHRRESFGEPMKHIFSAFLELVKKFPDIHVIYPVHPNPNVNQLAYEMLGKNPDFTLTKPIAYDKFVSLMKQAYLVCSDSGGLQEEAPALNKPLVILREKTERPLVVSLGLAKLAGTNQTSIFNQIADILTHEAIYHSMQKHLSPYGDGHAAEHIIDIIKQHMLVGITC